MVHHHAKYTTVMNIHKIMHFQLVLQHIKVFLPSMVVPDGKKNSPAVPLIDILVVMTLGGSFMVCKVDRSSNRFHTGRLT